MYYRAMQKELVTAAKQYPVVTLLGPRQAGKTTLVKQVFPGKPYVSLEDLDTRRFAEEDSRSFLSQFPNGAILDEIQRVPELLSYIQGIVDSKKTPGFFILTGSHQLALHEAVSQSLAGRTAILNLLPLTITELSATNIHLSLEEYLLNGFFPRVYADKLDPTKAYRNYLQTYIERDVRQLINIKDLKVFQNFLKLCAGRVGSILNKESLGNDVGISSHTVNQWLSILEASFIIFLLPPYFENFGKRIIKSPKLYFTDVGLVTYLLGIENIDQLLRDPLKGFLVENLVILELMKTRLNQGLEPQLYYFRDNHQHEIDVIYKQANQLIPIEIKSSATFSPHFLQSLHFYQNLVNPRAPYGYLIYTGKQEQRVGSISVLNFKATAEIFKTY